MQNTSFNSPSSCWHGGGGSQIGEVTCGWSPQLSWKRDQINERLYGQAGYLTPLELDPFLKEIGMHQTYV